MPGIKRYSRGFTLVELVAVIVLMGILAASSTQIIRLSMDTFTDVTRRSDLNHQARFAIERVSRELRSALPGSVRERVSGTTQCLEFMPIHAASSYLGYVAAAPQSSFEAAGFNFNDQGLTYSVAVATVGETEVYSGGNYLATLASVGGSDSDAQRTVNLTGAHQFVEESPQRRFYIVSQRVSFCLAANGRFSRYQGYGTDTSVPPGSGGALLAENMQLSEGGVTVNVFSYTPGTLQRSGVVNLDFRFNDPADTTEWVHFNHAVMLRNTP